MIIESYFESWQYLVHWNRWSESQLGPYWERSAYGNSLEAELAVVCIVSEWSVDCWLVVEVFEVEVDAKELLSVVCVDVLCLLSETRLWLSSLVDWAVSFSLLQPVKSPKLTSVSAPIKENVFHRLLHPFLRILEHLKQANYCVGMHNFADIVLNILWC